jgi:Rod binding domain-containing protein
VTPLAGPAPATLPPLAPLNASSPGVRPANSGSSSSPEVSRLHKAAGEFESILLESLWKSMKETFSDPDEDADPTLKSFDEWGMQALASAVGNSGGLGIKNMILKYLEPAVNGGGHAGPPLQ